MATSRKTPTRTDPLLQALLEQTSDGVLQLAMPDGIILDGNARAQELLGRAAGAMAGMRLQQLAPAAHQAALADCLRRALATDRTVHHACALERHGGYAFPCELRLRRVDAPEAGRLLVTFQDISERMRAQEDIELRNIAIANVTSGVTVADARQPDLPLIYVNRGFQNITGYSAKEAIGRSCRFLQGEDRDQPGLDVLRQALRAGEPCVVQLRNYRKDGTLFHNELHISPVRNDAGELTHFVGIQLEVTEQVKARESLERSEQRYRQALEREKELGAIKTRFISMVSHEFRTPMTGVQASAAFLRKFGDRVDAAKRASHLANIETSLKRMNRLLDDVLFFSRSESDKVTLRLEPLDLAAYMQRLVEGMGLIYPGRRIDCECAVPAGSRYLLDEHLLDHILQNLIGNAVKYSPDEAPVACTVTEQADALEFAVSDAGIGIPEADQAHLFEAFHRAGNVGTRQGTGLGLSIALRAAELLKGTIRFTSRENAGSTFVVRIPRILPS